MRFGTKQNAAHYGRFTGRFFLLAALLFGLNLSLAHADTIAAGSSLGVGGAYDIDGSTLTLNDPVMALTGSDPFNFDFFTEDGSFSNNIIDLTSSSQSTSFVIDGWQVDLKTLFQPPGQVGTITELDGNGFISGYGYDQTAAVWAITAQTSNSYSMTVTTVVPVPAAVWLFGSGLVGLIAVARRKAA